MDVRLVVLRRVHLNDELHGGDVEAARRDVRGYQHVEFTRLEALEHHLALRLRTAAVHVSRAARNVIVSAWRASNRRARVL